MKGVRAFATLATAASIAAMAGAQGISVFVNGEPVTFTGVGPRQIEGRVMVPLRGVMEKLGAMVSYLPESKSVIATKGDVDMQLRLGQRLARVNGRDVTLDVPAIAYAGTTMVPLRFMSEALGAQVAWDAPAMAVRITAPTTPVSTPPTQGGAAQPINNGPLSISSFQMDKGGFWNAGDQIHFTLQGTPGATATMQIPGITDPIRMAEVAPGRYEAIVTVPQGAMTINRANAVARLTLNGQEQLIQSNRRITIDTQPPTIMYPMPEGNTYTNTTMPEIRVNFEDLNGSGMARDSVRVLLDNRDVTDQAVVGGSGLTFTPKTALSTGQHTVRVEARDKAGNRADREWTFFINNRSEMYRGFTHTGLTRLEPGKVIRFELDAEPGSNVTYSIGDKVMDLPMRETTRGHYVGEYTVRLEDDLRGEPVIARLRSRENQVYVFQAPQLIGEIRAPMRPTITSPGTDRAVTGNTLNVQGTAGRRAKILVTVDYQTGGRFKSTGTLLERTVFADLNGHWETGPIRIDSFALGEGTTYTITAVAVGANDVRSEPYTVSVKR